MLMGTASTQMGSYVGGSGFGRRKFSYIPRKITPIPWSVNASLQRSQILPLMGSISGNYKAFIPFFAAVFNAAFTSSKGRDLPNTF